MMSAIDISIKRYRNILFGSIFNYDISIFDDNYGESCLEDVRGFKVEVDINDKFKKHTLNNNVLTISSKRCNETFCYEYDDVSDAEIAGKAFKECIDNINRRLSYYYKDPEVVDIISSNIIHHKLI